MKTNRELILSVLSVDQGLCSAEVIKLTGLREKQVSTALSAMVLRQKTVGRSKTPGHVSEYFLLKPYIGATTNIVEKLVVLRNVREVLPDAEQNIIDQIISDYERFGGILNG